MDEYKKYLADQILSEEKVVTYRSLSRALKIHVNIAKGMLYEFHRSQNAMRPGTIHATYLVYGIQKVEKVQEDGDVEMASSPPASEPLSEEIVTNTLTLVSGDRLKEVVATYEAVSSFHVYSLAGHPTKELQLLEDVSRQMREQSGDDSASMAEVYGSIANPLVRKRDRKGRAPAPAPAAAGPTPKLVKKEPAPSTTKPDSVAKTEETVKEESKPAAKQNPFSAAASKKNAAPPGLKKSGSSGIMSSFAKAAAKTASKPKEASKKATETPPNDSPALSDDGEDDDEDIPAAKPSAEGRKSRKEREADLKRMMEESEDEDPEEKEEEPVDEPMEEAPEPEPEAQKEAEPAEVVSSSGDGRRRGKRRVMKKKQIMDDQGYLVTIQEPTWEEFSEDEAPPPAQKPKPSTLSSSSSQGSKAKKPAPKGQGNIMSFFSKK
ncbi:DNA polymerase subunit cdc27 [Colletotrichum truncatum]|uniref:DNA polymerase subunit cdc27 n=1 Tax=Colletotrichum truncatum TaxID=5467 RepID=A0ACC3ZKG4_COLTU|nr:DNA polymerase subunit cdc27 [Colletotrichum truncatum]KAF6799982.1 DNA polymerase subunit cdc27 [Colletotrichum truncatum]